MIALFKAIGLTMLTGSVTVAVLALAALLCFAGAAFVLAKVLYSAGKLAGSCGI